jgi:hypothetical protein
LFINKIYCLGDGFAHGHIWPEWPQLLQCLFPAHNVICLTGIGAGNEFLISQLLDHDINQCTVIFQWAQPNRFDKLIEDTSWDANISQDSVYSENVIKNWWLSSASTNNDIQLYHNFFVQPEQAKLRMKIQQKLVESYLKDKQCKYILPVQQNKKNLVNKIVFNQYDKMKFSQIQLFIYIFLLKYFYLK